ncbi:MAG: iron-sulfur cluster repair di-iron protein, ric [Syntrophomonadaceae bacterium]|nr:iron-sulfur cluster repair di-iron protein, ric [Syntrophomonadaceae bacterium]
MSTFNETKENQFPKLEQFVPIVARVHGEHHPEFHDVHEVFDAINEKIKEAGTEKPELNEEFAKLRAITDNYKVPGDVCEAYEAVYNMLSEVDKAYQD